VGECFFWYRLTRVLPDKFHSAVKRLCVCARAVLTDLSPRPSVGLSLLVRKVYCGKMADWIQMPFGVVSGVSQGMGLLDGGGDRQRGRGSFGVEFVPLNPRFQRYIVCMEIL